MCMYKCLHINRTDPGEHIRTIGERGGDSSMVDSSIPAKRGLSHFISGMKRPATDRVGECKGAGKRDFAGVNRSDDADLSIPIPGF